MLVEEQTKRNIIVRKAEFPRVVSNLHWHENLEICMPLGDGVTFTVDGEIISSVPGDIFVIDEFVQHRISTKAPKTYLYIVHLRLSCLIERGIRLERIKPYITKAEIENIPMLSEKINFILKTLCDERSIEKEPRENPFLYSMAGSLYYLLMRHFAVPDRAAQKNTERADFYNIVDYINTNFKENINVNSVSSALFISARKLSEIFRRFSGMSINSYITSLRLKNANYLLMHGRCSSEAAYESGFQNLRTFNNAYKKQFGISPTEYIKRGGDVSSGGLM